MDDVESARPQSGAGVASLSHVGVLHGVPRAMADAVVAVSPQRLGNDLLGAPHLRHGGYSASASSRSSSRLRRLVSSEANELVTLPTACDSDTGPSCWWITWPFRRTWASQLFSESLCVSTVNLSFM